MSEYRVVAGSGDAAYTKAHLIRSFFSGDAMYTFETRLRLPVEQAIPKVLSKTSTGKTLYLLDEPTTGLHFEDVSVLLRLLHRLADRGNTVVVIEHNLDVIMSSDYIVDLGPGGGRAGGSIIAKGSPEEVAQVTTSYTARYINTELSRTH